MAINTNSLILLLLLFQVLLISSHFLQPTESTHQWLPIRLAVRRAKQTKRSRKHKAQGAAAAAAAKISTRAHLRPAGRARRERHRDIHLESARRHQEPDILEREHEVVVGILGADQRELVVLDLERRPLVALNAPIDQNTLRAAGGSSQSDRRLEVLAGRCALVVDRTQARCGGRGQCVGNQPSAPEPC